MSYPSDKINGCYFGLLVSLPWPKEIAIAIPK